MLIYTAADLEAATASATLRRKDLLGRWALVRYVGRAEDGGERYPAGVDPSGTLIYTTSGVSVHIVAADRRVFVGPDPWDGSPDEYQDAFVTYIGYWGTYETERDTVIHHVIDSSFPNWRGARLVRQAELRDDDLVLRTTPLQLSGDRIVNELHWRRLE